MALKIVVVDSGRLAAGVEFPPLDIDKYGWEQYPDLSGEDLAERCWRADIVVSLGAAITREVLEKMPRLRLLITAGDACGLLDQETAQARGVELLAFPEAGCRDRAEAQDLCNRVSDAINHYIRSFEA
jgi:lactate dehydrogenase-like 2-hydroxyacid dehydrogenase